MLFRPTHLDLVAEEARRLMIRHGVGGWEFSFDSARRRFGYCQYSTRTIQISRPLAEVNSWETIRDTVLHEIAHALVGPGHGHDQTWKEMAARVGARPERCYDSSTVVKPPGGWKATCARCGTISHRTRRPQRRYACNKCCRENNGGKFSEEFLLTFSKD